MTPAQVLLVRESYATIRNRQHNYAELFYHRLLQQHPFTSTLFPDDMTRQIEVFQQTLDALVEHADDLASLHPALKALAQRHVGYGVEKRHYAVVGDILIAMFAELLGEHFTPEVRSAWVAAYATTAGVMIEEAYP